MKPPRAQRTLSWLTAAWLSTACAWIVCLAVGCSSVPWGKVPLDAATGFYNTTTLTYRLDAGKLAQPLDVVRVDGQRVGYEQVASSPLADQSIGTLTITYPHPDGRTGKAEARFALDSMHGKPAAKSWNPFKKKPSSPTSIVSAQPEIHEAWSLDIASSESDELFKLLANQGFHNSERAQTIGVELAVKINGTQKRKNWDQVAELNSLIQRVRRDGQLVAYSRPAFGAGNQRGAIANTRAYSDLLAQTGPESGSMATGSMTTGRLGTSPFSMPPPPADSPVYPQTIARLPPGAR